MERGIQSIKSIISAYTDSYSDFNIYIEREAVMKRPQEELFDLNQGLANEVNRHYG
jgi:hypothetical protein